MASGWAGDGAVQDQIQDSINDEVARARRNLPKGESLHFCDRRHEHYGGRVGDRGRKQDTGKCESGKNTVDAECFAGRNSIHLKPLRNQNDFNSGKHGEKKPIHRNRKGSTEDFM